MTIEHKPWPKIARLANETMTITEKIDGTNACVVFLPNPDAPFGFEFAAQSRSKLITPEDDNAGFAKFVYTWTDELFADLGFGYHYGEFWGSGIQRGYGFQKGQKFFSLFNAPRWNRAFEEGHTFKTPQLGVVPILATGPLDGVRIQDAARNLYEYGSYAAPGYPTPEGVVIHLKEAGATYKITDAAPGPAKHLT